MFSTTASFDDATLWKRVQEFKVPDLKELLKELEFQPLKKRKFCSDGSFTQLDFAWNQSKLTLKEIVKYVEPRYNPT